MEFNHLYRQLASYLLGKKKIWQARWRRQVFNCQALNGKSNYNICINSDMTVSCNCNDVDGAGQLGNLKTTSFENIFFGDKAERFRRLLAQRKLPIVKCAVCPELRLVDATAVPTRDQISCPVGLMVENTSLCNLRCRSCSRATLEKIRQQKTLTLKDIEIVAETLARIGVRYCTYYNLGEPFLSPNILDELQIVRRHNPEMCIQVSTNGLFLDSDDNKQAALLCNDVHFSIDGISTPMVNIYQRRGDFDRAYSHLRSLVDYRNARGNSLPQIGWKYIVFRWNDKPEYIHQAIEMARKAGVDYIRFDAARTPLTGISPRFFWGNFFQTIGESGGPLTRKLNFDSNVRIIAD